MRLSSQARPRSTFFTINRPEWQRSLPRGRRIAAEWLFGTVIIGGIQYAIRTGDLVAIPTSFFVSFVLFLFMSGWNESKRINNPILWWAFVLFMSGIGAFALILSIVDPPEHFGR